MFNPTAYENSRHDGIGVLELVNHHERVANEARVFVPLKPTEMRGEAVGPLAATEELHGQLHMRGARMIPVQDYINARTGVQMVNHGGQAQAIHKIEDVDAFGPGGEQEHWIAAKLQQQHASWQRRTLAGSK